MRVIQRLGLFAAALSSAACDGSATDMQWRGVDLSYVNELEDCGAVWKYSDGRTGDPYEIMADAGANIVRLRLWHNPDWTEYSTLDDVKKSIRRAKDAGMKVLLDFHYSDDWAHPGKQLPPAAWEEISDPDYWDHYVLESVIWAYTKQTLTELVTEGLAPDFVQTGNEINTNMFWPEEVAEDAPIDWDRNVRWINAALDAVAATEVETGHNFETMLHVAQPENVEPWLAAATAAGLEDFDIFGLSYYAKWSSTPMSEITPFVERVKTTYNVDVVVVETAYPFTFDANDAADNLLGEDTQVEGYPGTVEGQRQYMLDLNRNVLAGGGLGVVYWEPAWISSSCQTRWGDGSHWENAALFDFDGKLHDGAAFLSAK